MFILVNVENLHLIISRDGFVNFLIRAVNEVGYAGSQGRQQIIRDSFESPQPPAERGAEN